jgi:hypothetical protein
VDKRYKYAYNKHHHECYTRETTLFMKTLTTLLLLITLSASAQLEAYHLYKVYYPDTEVTVVNGTGSAHAYLLANWGTTNEVADLNGDGVVSASDNNILLGSWGQVLWNEAQYNCGGKFTQYQCFSLFIQDQKMFVAGWYQYASDVVRVTTFNPVAEWYFVQL